MATGVGMAEGSAVPVEVRGTAGAYALYRGGEPYAVRGAGIGSAAALPSLARHGGNSVRTWAVGDGSILDAAAEHGLTVALCLDLARERHGFDYGDRDAVARQLERARTQVLAHRNHPALLFWIIGNELNHDFTDPRVYDAVNDISEMIHRLDPNHPTTTATAGIDPSLARVIETRAPDLDFLSVQLYGGLAQLPAALADAAVESPVMVTEWGTIGHWEVRQTPWGAPLEPTSTAKARRFLDGHETVLGPMEGRLIGSYAFLWGHKQERTPTWYGVLTADGRRTEAADVLRRIWTGAWPANQAPRLLGLRVDGKAAADQVRLRAGAPYVAKVDADDPDDDPLRFEWVLMRESDATQSGGDAETVPERVTVPVVPRGPGEIGLRAPAEPGAYRLFVYVGDGHGAAAHANLPFLVTGA
ncbi:MAG: hypothetical protein OXM56_08485 [Gammaproteobacteria bacterium]|nr:hypothetical protein [Gammaproteobacteria bacterium]